MKKKILIRLSVVVFTLSIVLSSCKEQKITEGDRTTIDMSEPFTTINPNIVKKIHLNSTEPIGDISKFVSHDNYFYIMDFPAQTVWKFHENGDVIWKIHNVGNGVGEYAKLLDIDVLPNGDLCVLDLSKRKILRYDSDSCNYVSEIKLPGIALSFCAVDSATFLLNNAGGEKGININLGILSTDGMFNSIINAKYENEYLALGANPTHFWRSRDEIIYYDRFTPNFYIFSDSLSPFFSLVNCDIPNESDVENMVKATRGQDFTNDGIINDKIADTSYAYKTTEGLLLGLKTFPQKHIFKSIFDGKCYILDYNNQPDFRGAMIGAIGVFEDCFVTEKVPYEEDENQTLILYRMTDNS